MSIENLFPRYLRKNNGISKASSSINSYLYYLRSMKISQNEQTRSSILMLYLRSSHPIVPRASPPLKRILFPVALTKKSNTLNYKANRCVSYLDRITTDRSVHFFTVERMGKIGEAEYS